jgi:hypothetical protein
MHVKKDRLFDGKKTRNNIYYIPVLRSVRWPSTMFIKFLWISTLNILIILLYRTQRILIRTIIFLICPLSSAKLTMICTYYSSSCVTTVAVKMIMRCTQVHQSDGRISSDPIRFDKNPTRSDQNLLEFIRSGCILSDVVWKPRLGFALAGWILQDPINSGIGLMDPGKK